MTFINRIFFMNFTGAVFIIVNLLSKTHCFFCRVSFFDVNCFPTKPPVYRLAVNASAACFFLPILKLPFVLAAFFLN